MSLLNKHWKYISRSTPSNIVDQLLANRSIETHSVEQFFYPDIAKHSYSPYLMEDMQKSVERVKTALEKKERIIIFGDYDVDGTTGTAVLYHILSQLGALVSYRIPHRLEDGYGMKDYFVEEIAKAQANLIITVDNGISANKEVALANTHGIDVIITDHHEPPDPLPEAYSILNPRLEGCAYPNKGLSGSMVAYKFMEALSKELLTEEKAQALLDTVFDIAVVGLVADCMPLTGENRTLVAHGLKLLKKTQNPGLINLFTIAGIRKDSITAGTIGFQIGPRINASGRLESAYHALHLLIHDHSVSQKKAPILEDLNQARRAMVQEGYFQAIKEVGDDPREHIILAASPEWNPGINGLIASRLQEKFARPIIVLSEKEGVLTASARSIEAYNIIEAIRANSEYLDHFGGHPQAAGFSLKKENYPAFKKAMESHARRALKSGDLKHTLTIDCVLRFDNLNWETLTQIEQFEPFGIGNPNPTFCLHGVHGILAEKMGKDHSHLRLTIPHNGESFKAVGFGMGHLEKNLRPGKTYDLAFQLQRNSWKGNDSLQLMLKDIALSS